MEKLDTFCKWFIWGLICLALGYFWCFHTMKNYEGQAEKDLTILEEQFHESLEKPRSFHIFNGQFEVYPVNLHKKRFVYKKKKR